MRRFSGLLATLVGLVGCTADAPPHRELAPKPVFRTVRKVAHGRLEEHGGLRLLRLWGTARERGRAHGVLLAEEIASLYRRELEARFSHQPGVLLRARAMLPLMVRYPADVDEEIKAMFEAVVEHASIALPRFRRNLDLIDARVINAMDVLATMGCSGFSVWGDQVAGGGVLSTRNFDWPITGRYLAERCLLVVQHPADGTAFATVGWPGYVGAVTGVSAEGVAIYLHVGNSRGRLPRPGSMPAAVAARRILAGAGRKGTAPLSAEDVFTRAKEELAETSPPRGYLARVVLPNAGEGHPARVFEVDLEGVTWQVDSARCVVTNHFLSRLGQRRVSRDSEQRRIALEGCLERVADAGRAITRDDAWATLAAVERRRANFATLHSLVFRAEPWVFELALAEWRDGAAAPVAAPSSSRRFRLPRAQLFAPVD
ncbi:MAG: hypothetical protein KDC87_12565 [Planctomycetes bacterium]|nr:hypothetical protein [Planctomycetota bacterium]